MIIRFWCNHQVFASHEVTESRNAVIIKFYSVTIRYVLPSRLQKAEKQLLLDVTVIMRYVLPTRLQKAQGQLLLDFRVTIRYVLPTYLKR